MDWFRQGVRGFHSFCLALDSIIETQGRLSWKIFAILKQYRHAGLVRHTKNNDVDLVLLWISRGCGNMSYEEASVLASGTKIAMPHFSRVDGTVHRVEGPSSDGKTGFRARSNTKRVSEVEKLTRSAVLPRGFAEYQRERRVFVSDRGVAPCINLNEQENEMSSRHRFGTIMLVVALTCLCIPSLVYAAGKTKVTFFMNLYEGLTQQYFSELQNAFNSANPNLDLEIVPVDWEMSHDKLTTAIAGGSPPDASIIGTYWLVEFMNMNAVEEVTKYVSKATIANIAAGAMEAKINGKLMGLPVAAGPRILAINADTTPKVPATMEELRAEATRVNNPPDVYGLIMPGMKTSEPTDFIYYLYAAGGDIFETKADGSYGKCVVNSPAGVKALSFMVDLATKDKVAEEGYLALIRKDAHPLFAAGKGAYCFTGAWMDGLIKQTGSKFNVKYAQIPPFKGVNGKTLIITDSIAIFKGAQNKGGAGKFLDFFYQDQWKARWDEAVGFPPVTISAGKLPQFQTPLYKALIQANGRAKGYPLVADWDQAVSIMWDASVDAFLGKKTPRNALDDAASQIDKLRGM